MAITVRELLDVPYLRLNIYAGESGMWREIRWAQVSELPDPSDWLEFGGLVMTTGLGLPKDSAGQERYVEKLAQDGLSGLLIGERPGERVNAPDFTDSLVSAANAHSLPILTMPYELPFGGVAHTVAEANHGQEHARLVQALRVYDTVRLMIGTLSGPRLVDRLGDVAGCDLYILNSVTVCPLFADTPEPPSALMSELAKALSNESAIRPAVIRLYSDSHPAVAMAVPASRPTTLLAAARAEDSLDLFLLRHIAAIVALEVERDKAERERRRRLGAELLSDLIDNRIEGDTAAWLLADWGMAEEPRVLAASSSGEVGKHSELHLRLEERGIKHLMRRRSEALVILLPATEQAVRILSEEIGSAIGLSDPLGRLTRTADALRESLWALYGAQATGRRMVRYGKDTASPFLPRTVSESHAIVRHILGPILDYDEKNGGQLVESLRTYLRQNRSLKGTSEALHIHKQTVIYRMHRVEEITGRRLDRMEDIVDFWLALRSMEIASGRLWVE